MVMKPGQHATIQSEFLKGAFSKNVHTLVHNVAGRNRNKSAGPPHTIVLFQAPTVP